MKAHMEMKVNSYIYCWESDTVVLVPFMDILDSVGEFQLSEASLC